MLLMQPEALPGKLETCPFGPPGRVSDCVRDFAAGIISVSGFQAAFLAVRRHLMSLSPATGRLINYGNGRADYYP